MAYLTHVKFCSAAPQCEGWRCPRLRTRTKPPRRSRGDRQREAIVTAVRELVQERSFADLSVSTISERAGVARSGFYFYFDSKYAVLAVILADASELLDQLTHHFAPREPGETPAAFAKRMVGSAAAVYANDDPVLSACAVAREYRCADRRDDGRLLRQRDRQAHHAFSNRTPMRARSPTTCPPWCGRWRRRRP